MKIAEIAASFDGGNTHDCGHDLGSGENALQSTAQIGQSTNKNTEDYYPMRYERYRLKTFKTWPNSTNADNWQYMAFITLVMKMMTGFLLLPKNMKKWEKEDNIQKEHKKNRFHFNLFLCY